MADEPTSFRIHTVDWTRDKSARFWNYIASRPAFQEFYFSRQVGDAVIKFVRKHGAKLRGRVLDFGCGPGYLVEYLVKNGVAAEGADFSAESVEQLRHRLEGNPLFRGAHVLQSLPTDLEPESFDVVFFIETIEHLMDDDLNSAIAEIHRILRRDGQLIVTTPNEENLDLNECLCPDCGASFHRIQHVRTWSAKSLTAFLAMRGFDSVAVRTTFFRGTLFTTRLFSLAARVLGKKQRNLVYIGTKW